MSASEGRHAAPDPTPGGDEVSAGSWLPGGARRSGLANPKATRSVRFWTVPIVITLAILGALAAFYLGGILNPMTNLRHFPIAVVNEDAGPTGAQVVKGLQSGFDHDAYDVRVLSHDDAKHQLDTAQIYGVAVIPPNFSSKLQTYAKSAVTPGRVQRPVIIVSTNPRAGTLGASIAGQTLTRAITMMDHRVGQRLSQDVAQQTHGAPMAAAVTLMLANPIEVESTVHNALPDGTGNGLSAFYYALLLLLAGFTGSFVVSMLVDSMLGFVPAEFGPVYRFAEQVTISRLRTLLIKWALMVVLALLTSGGYMLIAAQLGMPIQHSLPLWLFGAFAITAVGITSTSLIAVLGALGLLVSMFVFVILGLPSAGATVPLQAAPPLFGWLAKFEPMHQVFLGTRALLYLDGQADAGLSHALTMSAIGLLIGLLLGGIVTRIYDRRGYHRIPSGVEGMSPSGSAASTELTEPAATTETTNTAE
jgi:YhgE/Pip-like protein